MTLPPHGPDEVRRIAALARIRLGKEEAVRLSADFGRILGHVDSLRARNEADEVEPLVHAVPPGEAASTLRPDETAAGPAAPLPFETTRALAPDAAGRHLRVPRVLEEGR